MWTVGFDIQNLVLLVVIAAAAAWIALYLASRTLRIAPEPKADPARRDVAFLFVDDALVDASPAAQNMFDLAEAGGADLARLLQFLAPRFPGIHAQLAGRAGTDAAMSLASSDGLSQLDVTGTKERLHLRLQSLTEHESDQVPDPHSAASLRDALVMHRTLSNGMPFPVWRQSTEGRMLWANDEYQRLAKRAQRGDKAAAEPGALFSEPPDITGNLRPVQRVRLDLPQEAEPKWFEYQINKVGPDLLVAALPVDRIVRAERSLNGFVQTLTQTFAHLNVGLAIFNRTRELMIFNPALNKLLELQPEFLVQRPTLTQVFNRLREQRMIPEQKDYASWRRKLEELEAAVTDDFYSETWSLTDGRTIRVSGRPHPEGAVAFLFEDISEEILLERKFRTELQMSNAVIEGLDEALAVFTPAGKLALSNAAYNQLWYDGVAPSEEMRSFVEATRVWQKNCLPTPVWGDARDFAATIGERSNWTAKVRLRGGGQIACRFETLAGGFTLVGFTQSRQAIAEHSALPQERITA